MALVGLVGGLLTWLLGFGGLNQLRHVPSDTRHTQPASYPNPFSTDPNDRVDAMQADVVKADLFRAFRIENAAFASGDASLLSQSDTGNSLQKLQQLIIKNNSQGIFQRGQNHYDSVVVGRLHDPITSGVTWCVELKGKATDEDVTRADGRVIATRPYSFDLRYWMVKSGPHYLITDVGFANQPAGG